jgi:hypothetical protein
MDPRQRELRGSFFRRSAGPIRELRQARAGVCFVGNPELVMRREGVGSLWRAQIHHMATTISAKDSRPLSAAYFRDPRPCPPERGAARGELNGER